MSITKRYLAALVGVVGSLLLMPGCLVVDFDGDSDGVRNTNSTATAPFFFEVPLDQQRLVRVEAVNGIIEIIGGGRGDEIVVSGERRVGSESGRDAERHLGNLQVRIIEAADEIVIRTIQPDNSDGRDYTVDYTITLPDGLDLDVDHVNGIVELDDFYGGATVDLVNGEVVGSVVLPRDAVVDMAVINGLIDLEIPRSPSAAFSASVTNGDVRVFNLNLRDLIQSQNRIRGTLGEGEGRITLEILNGDIEVRGF